MNRLLACAAAALLLGACASTEKELIDKGMKPLDATRAQALLSGNTATGTTASGNGFIIYNAPDGTSRGKSGSSSDAGKWEVTSDGQHCNQCISSLRSLFPLLMGLFPFLWGRVAASVNMVPRRPKTCRP